MVTADQIIFMHPQVQHKVQEARTVLSEGLVKPAAKILTTYAVACIVYGNGQRSGAHCEKGGI